MRYQHRHGFGGEPVTSQKWGLNIIAVVSAIVPIIRRFLVNIDERIFNVRKDV